MLSRIRKKIAAFAAALMWAAGGVGVVSAQATPPNLSPGGISGAVGGGQAAGAQVPVASPPPMSSGSGYTPSRVTPNATVNPGGTGMLRSTVLTSRRDARRMRMFRRHRR